MAYRKFPRKKQGAKRYPRRRLFGRGRKGGALAVAKQALSLAKRTMMSATETKYLSYNLDSDVAGSANIFGSALEEEMTSVGGDFSPVFGTDGVTGNKSYLKYIKGDYEIHMDNLNNEEETCNFTVCVVKPRSDHDNLSAAANNVVVHNGVPFFNPRLLKVCYYRRHTLTMGGTSPGTSGQMIGRGRFYIPVNKMIRLTQQGGTQATVGHPASNQDRYWFLIYTDNTTADTENPRVNAHLMQCWRDVDLNHT